MINPTANSDFPSPKTQDIKRDFPSVLDLGANTCNIARALTRPSPSPSDPDSPPSGVSSGPPPSPRA